MIHPEFEMTVINYPYQIFGVLTVGVGLVEKEGWRERERERMTLQRELPGNTIPVADGADRFPAAAGTCGSIVVLKR